MRLLTLLATARAACAVPERSAHAGLMRNVLLPRGAGQRLIALVALGPAFLDTVLEHARALLFSPRAPAASATAASPTGAAPRARTLTFFAAYAALVHRQPARPSSPLDGPLHSGRSSEWPSAMMSSVNLDMPRPPVAPLQGIGLHTDGDDVLLDRGPEGGGSVHDGLGRGDDASIISGGDGGGRSRRGLTRSAALQVRADHLHALSGATRARGAARG